MSIHIWCPRASESARLLRDAIRSQGVECHKSPSRVTPRRFNRFIQRVQGGDLLINWGSPFRMEHLRGGGEGVRRLNSASALNKRTQLLKLYQKGVLVPEVYDEPGDGRIGRSLNHTGGTDLLNETGRDYWTQKVNLDYEFRVHVFQGKSIRAGIKVHRNDVTPHPWIRSYDGGWRIDYGQAGQRALSDRVRNIAKHAVDALGLDFGAVDVGLLHGRSPRTPIVLEVNTAPGLDQGPSVDAYVRHILAVYRGDA